MKKDTKNKAMWPIVEFKIYRERSIRFTSLREKQLSFLSVFQIDIPYGISQKVNVNY
jgi:hypothetical protein